MIEWPKLIEESILRDIVSFKKHLQKEYIEQKVYVKSAYNSLLISYDTIIEDVYNSISFLKELYQKKKTTSEWLYSHWKIPVCYDDKFALDLEDVAQQNNLLKEEVIKRHSQNLYTVYFIGFLPGFLYLGGLDNQLATPRKSNPRLHIEKGAVAIGGSQTGIYPNVSPGGWNVIGNSPISFFDATSQPPCFTSPGDKIEFISISKSEYDDIKARCDQNKYQLERKVIHG